MTFSDGDDDFDFDSSDAEGALHAEFREHKDSYYITKLDYNHVTPWVPSRSSSLYKAIKSTVQVYFWYK